MTSPEKSKIKILLVVRWPVGGIRTFHRYVYKNFSPEQYTFTLVAPDIDEVHVLLSDLAQFRIKFIKVSSRPTIQELGTVVFTTLKKGHYSIVHAHGLSSALSAALPAKLFSVPLLITLHDVFVGPVLKGVKGFGKRIVLSRLWATAHTVHCVGEDCKENLLTNFPGLRKQDERITTIANGIDVNNFLNAVPLNLRTKLAECGPKPVYLIGFLGRFMAQKGFRYLVEALEIILQRKELLSAKPLILVFGVGGFFREEKSLLEEKGIASSFRFLPFESNIASVLKGLDLVVMPSLWEACGLLAMETLVSGVPLVGSDCIGLREVLHDTPAVTVSPGDGQALGDAILQEMKQPSLVASKAFQGEAARRFNVKARAEELKQLYSSIADNKI